MNILVLSRLPIIDASSRQRVYQFKKILENNYNINITFSSFYSECDFIKHRNGKLKLFKLLKLFIRRINEIKEYKEYDAVWILRSTAPIEMTFLVKFMKKNNIPIIFEFDDAIYLGEKATKLRTKLLHSWDKVSKYIENSNAIIVGNDTLEVWAKQYNKQVYVIPTGVDVEQYSIKVDFKENDVFTIGWIGSVSTAPNLELVIPAIEELSKKIKIRFIVLGGLPLSINNKNIEYYDIPWSLENQDEFLKKFDVGIAPLYDTPFNRGKCGYKMIQYMATGIPVIASPVGVQSSIISNSNNGFLANTTEEWTEYLLKLADDIELRTKLGYNSRKYAEKNYDINVIVKDIAKVIISACKTKGD